MESRPLVGKEVALMRRIISVLAVAALMAVMLVAMAAPAFADSVSSVHSCKAVLVSDGNAPDCPGFFPPGPS